MAIDPIIQRGINHSFVNTRVMKDIAHESIQSAARIIQKVADSMGIPEEKVVEVIKKIPRRDTFDIDSLTKEIFNHLLKVEDTHNYIDDFNKEKNKRKPKQEPNKIYIP